MTSVKFKLRDSEGRDVSSTWQLENEGTDTITDILAAVAAQATLLGNVTELAVIEASITLKSTFAPIAGSGTAADNRDRGATFRVEVLGAESNPNYNMAVKIPGIIAAAQDGQGGIDLANAAVAAWFATFDSVGGSWRVNKNTPSPIENVLKGTLDK